MTDINILLSDSIDEYDLPSVVSLLDQGADIHLYDDYALHRFAEKGDLDAVRILLDRGADIHSLNNYAFRAAAENGHLEVVRFLLDQEADIHANADEAIMTATTRGHVEIVRLLLDRGANICVHEYSTSQPTPEEGFSDMLVYLLYRGADPHASVYGLLFDIARTIIAHSQYRLPFTREATLFFGMTPGLLQARRAVRYALPSLIKPYLYSPWSRFATESLELLHLEGDEETNRLALHKHRDTLITKVIDNPRWTHDFLLNNYSSVPWGDESSTGLRSLIGEGNPRPSRRQLICRLPTSILEELAT